ncbi:NAD(P)-dependent oxidoreductase [Rhodoferax lacus]|uniref:NAD(P)-dependent oxidoreductase n=1 Tax=Rhodoferax lacus TaxID=2184758 RepID=A0A3E1R7N3_9BURK|nr:SDR family NAD(P)-dependent oxidoreductase [Rhodoferax lacus]RFO95253.1 NAD(P)-dependent oxidoreductase [Rhodoferax lacus]
MPKKLALITGSSGGIGAAIAAAASRDGYRLALLDVNAAALQATSASLPDATAFTCDITDAAQVAQVLQTLGQVPELLVNNAGIVKFAPLLDITVQDFRRILDIDLTGAFVVSQQVASGLRDAGKPGSIVNIASIGGITPSFGTNAYAAAKAGLIKLTELMALEWGALGIRVNTVSPGFIDGGMSAAVYANASTRAVRTAAVPLKRLGLEQDIADAVLFLASEKANYISGHNLVVDGALTHSLLNQIPRE